MTKTALKYGEALLGFIAESPTAYQAADVIAKKLRKSGATELFETEKWAIEAGKTYFVERNGSSLLAFTVPEGAKGFRVWAAHSDAPVFKIKENPEIQKDGGVVLNTEIYGGVMRSTWTDRPLSVAGRVIVKRGGKLVPVLVDLKEPAAVIPNLAIHMDWDFNKGKELNPQKELPLFAMKGKNKTFMETVAEAAGVEEKEIIGHDLFLYPCEKGVIWGPEGTFLSSPRLDDQECSFGGFLGFTEASRSEHISLFAMFDNEEVGSSTRQGAASTFLKDTIRRISGALGDTEEEFQIRLADSFLLSADNGHALHPNHEEKCDPTNRPVLNKGLLIKFNANQKYTTDGWTSAFVKDLCEQAKVPFQLYFNRSDVKGGSTLGNLSLVQLPFPSADIGLPQLAMHSAYETAGTEDFAGLVKLAKAFFS